MAEWNLTHRLHAVLRNNAINMVNAMIIKEMEKCRMLPAYSTVGGYTF